MTSVIDDREQAAHSRESSAPAVLVVARLGMRRLPRPAVLWTSLLAAIAPLIMLREVLLAPRMNAVDFWNVLARVTGDAGEFTIRGALSLQNEHPTILPGLAYYASARWFSADNRVLGLLTWLMAAAVLAALLWLLPRRLPGLARTSLVVLLPFLVFAPKGLHNFAYGMSGTAWWMANLFVVAALLAWHLRRRVVGLGLGVLASMSYGTGFAVWPALVAFAVVRREWRWAVPPLVLGPVAVVFWRLLGGAENGVSQVGNAGPFDVLATALAASGSLWSSESFEVAVVAGAVAAALLLVAAVRTWYPVRHGDSAAVSAPLPAADLAPWLALGVYAGVSALLIGQSRAQLGTEALAGRYASIAGLATAATAVLAVSAVAGRWALLPLGLAAAVVLGTAGASTVAATGVRGHYVNLELSAVAVRLGVPGAVPEAVFDRRATPALQALGGHPFDDGFDLGCGAEVGDVVGGGGLPDLIGLSAVPGDLSPAEGAVVSMGSVDEVRLGPAAAPFLRVDGWAVVGGEPARCVLVTDRTGRVTGGGVVGRPRVDLLREVRGDVRVGFSAVSTLEARFYRVLFVGQDEPGGSDTYVVDIDTRLAAAPPLEG